MQGDGKIALKSPACKVAHGVDPDASQSSLGGFSKFPKVSRSQSCLRSEAQHSSWFFVRKVVWSESRDASRNRHDFDETGLHCFALVSIDSPCTVSIIITRLYIASLRCRLH